MNHKFISSLFVGLISLPAYAAKKQPLEGAWHTFKADNGLEIVAMAAPKVPLVTIVLVSHAGAMTETKESNGLTHLWEHMFFKGNARLPDQEAFNRRVRQLGIVFNGDTSAEIVRYYFTLPSSNIDSGLQFMADAISSPLLADKELERERKVVMDEYDRAASQPGFDLHNIERMLIYGDQEHLRNALGRRSIIERASREQLLQIKSDVFVPANCALIVAGDFDPRTLGGMVNKHFGAWTTPKDWKPLNRGAFPAFPKSEEIVVKHPMAQNTLLQIAFQGPRALVETNDTLAADFLISLLEQRSGRFYKKYIDSGLTLNTALGYHTQGRAGELEIYSMVPSKNAIKTRDLLYQEPNEWLSSSFFSKGQLEDVRRKLIINHKFELNKPSEFAKTLAFWWGTTGMDYLDHYLPAMEKVSIADVQAFIRKYLIGKPRLTTMLINPKDAEQNGIADNSAPYRERFLKNYESK